MNFLDDLEVWCDWRLFFTARLRRLPWGGLHDEPKERVRRRLSQTLYTISREQLFSTTKLFLAIKRGQDFEPSVSP